MALDIHRPSPVSLRSSLQEPYSYAAEHALSEKELTVEELEAAVKETPPRPTSTLINGHVRKNSEPRALGDVMDESEKMLPPGSPSLRHTKGRLENNKRPSSPNESYAAVAMHEPLDTSGLLDSVSEHDLSATDKMSRSSLEQEKRPTSSGSFHGVRRKPSKPDSIGSSKQKDASYSSASWVVPRSASSRGESFANVVKHEVAGPDGDVRPSIKLKEEQHDANNTKLNGIKQESVDEKVNLAGAPKFEPEDSADSYATVVKHEPTSPVLPPSTPPSIQEPTGAENYMTREKYEPTTQALRPSTPSPNPISADAESYANVVKHEPISPVLRPSSPPSTEESVLRPSPTPSTEESVLRPSTPSPAEEPAPQPSTPSPAEEPVPQPSTPYLTEQPVPQPSTPSPNEEVAGTESIPEQMPTEKDHYPSPPSSADRDEGDMPYLKDQVSEAQQGSLISESDQLDSTYGTQAGSKPETSEEAVPGTLVYENYESRSGSNLASIALGKEYELALSQRENKIISSEPPSEKAANEDRVSTLVSGRRAGAGWSRSAVRWAPHNVPLQRRLQTLAVLAHSLSIASFVAFFFFLCAIPIFWPVILPYLIYVLLSSAATDGKLSHRSEYIRRSKFWSAFASYFPARLHRTVELPPTRKYIFGYHPHGIISHGAFAAFTTEALGFSSLFPGITNTLLTLDSNFRIPIYRDWILRLGLASVSRESCENILSRGGPNGQGMGRAITIVVGGARESLDAKPGTLKLVLAKRKGFIKLAVRAGADLVPVLAFGENDMYEQVDADTHPWVHKGQLALKRFMGFTVPLFHARGVFNYDVGIMPYRRPINIVVGRPIKTVMAKSPNAAYVDELHKQYTDELLHIWYEWKDTFAPDRKDELQIVE